MDEDEASIMRQALALGGIAYALPPIPVGCGGMRGVLLPGGKRGEELVRYAAGPYTRSLFSST
jgi:hypothetical protein